MEKYFSLRRIASFAVLVMMIAAMPYFVLAAGDEVEIPFSEANVFFELNNTDGDLGFHALIDGEPWKSLRIEDTKERKILDITLKGRLRKQGLTELFFESAEPPFESDDPGVTTLTPEAFFKRFPEGEYEIEGITLDGKDMESTSVVTHVMPAPPYIYAGGIPVPEDCDEGPVPEVTEPFSISWDPVTTSHPDLGRSGEAIEVVRYELVVEREDTAPLKFSANLAPTETSFQFPSGLVSPGDLLKIEVLVREASGNQTATESCFAIAQ